MQPISPKGFAIAIGILVLLWIILPDSARVPLAIVLILGALAMTRQGPELINRVRGLLK